MKKTNDIIIQTIYIEAKDEMMQNMKKQVFQNAHFSFHFKILPDGLEI